ELPTASTVSWPSYRLFRLSQSTSCEPKKYFEKSRPAKLLSLSTRVTRHVTSAHTCSARRKRGSFTLSPTACAKKTGSGNLTSVRTITYEFTKAIARRQPRTVEAFVTQATDIATHTRDRYFPRVVSSFGTTSNSDACRLLICSLNGCQS